MHLNLSIKVHWSSTGVSLLLQLMQCVGHSGFYLGFSSLSHQLDSNEVMVNQSWVHPTLLLQCVFLEFQAFAEIKCTFCHFGLVQLLCFDTNSLSLKWPAQLKNIFLSKQILKITSRVRETMYLFPPGQLLFGQNICLLLEAFVAELHEGNFRRNQDDDMNGHRAGCEKSESGKAAGVREGFRVNFQ